MLKMREYKIINSFMTKVNELVLGIRCAGGTLEEDEIVAKLWGSFPPTYKHKVVAIDGIKCVTTMTRDMLVGNIAAFELSEFGELHQKSVTTFRASISRKKKYHPDECKVSRYEREKRDKRERKIIGCT